MGWEMGSPLIHEAQELKAAAPRTMNSHSGQLELSLKALVPCAEGLLRTRVATPSGSTWASPHPRGHVPRRHRSPAPIYLQWCSGPGWEAVCP